MGLFAARLFEQQAAAAGLLRAGVVPWPLSVLCPGLHAMLGVTAGRSGDLALQALGFTYIHGVSLYRGAAGRSGVQTCRRDCWASYSAQQLPGDRHPPAARCPALLVLLEPCSSGGAPQGSAGTGLL